LGGICAGGMTCLHFFIWILQSDVSNKQIKLMAQLNTAEDNNQIVSRKRAGVRRLSKHNLKIDMTPMVDLGFLLISFFVITTELSKPTVMDLAMTKEGPPIDLPESSALTVLIDKGNVIFYYDGKWEAAVKKNKIKMTGLSGKDNLRSIINEKQKQLDANVKTKDGRNGLMLLIKPGQQSNYKTIIDVLDETTINAVKKYAVLKQSKEEAEWLKLKE
jgi:biopolymer transport protein ExbD